jgi:glutathione S-transferase
MELRHSPTSPYVRKVMIAAIETGQAGKLRLVPGNVWAADSDIGKVNPLGKVPALTTDGGETLFDSPVICEYLDSLHSGPKLLPAQGGARWRALRLQALADGMLDAAILRRLESQRPQEKQSRDWMDRQKRVVERGLDALEAEAEALEGPLTLGTIAVGCALGYLDFRFAAERWRQGHPKLAAWYEKTAKRKSFLDTVPKDPA